MTHTGGKHVAASILSRGYASLDQLPFLLSDGVDPNLEALAQIAHRRSLAKFGRTIQLYTPVYLSNACENHCLYCGFSARNDMPRVTLGPDEIDAELDAVRAEGFGHVLLVTGEAPGAFGLDAIVDAVRRAKRRFASVSVEIYPLDEAGYRELVDAGADGLVLYQETYDRALYGKLHPAGPKADYDWRLEAPARAASAGFRKIGLGVLLGLDAVDRDVEALVAHLTELRRRYWKVFFTLSVPRMRAASGGMRPRVEVSTRDLARLVIAFRLLFEDVGIVVSTRESAATRDGLLPLGVTQMSAGSRTEPGGYQRPGSEAEQFSVDDDRSPGEIARTLAGLGYDGVWKDWERDLG
jgi:2-iminoacetate synthase